MAENVYEGMFILESGRYSRDATAVVDQISRPIEEAGGKILVSRPWQESRLAYPIKGHRKGVYWLTYFRLDAARLAEVRRQWKLSESILRFLSIKHDPRIVDMLVAHALAGPSAQGEHRPAQATAPAVDEILEEVAVDETDAGAPVGNGQD